jgi:hypothetical protein
MEASKVPAALLAAVTRQFNLDWSGVENADLASYFRHPFDVDLKPIVKALSYTVTIKEVNVLARSADDYTIYTTLDWRVEVEVTYPLTQPGLWQSSIEAAITIPDYTTEFDGDVYPEVYAVADEVNFVELDHADNARRNLAAHLAHAAKTGTLFETENGPMRVVAHPNGTFGLLPAEEECDEDEQDDEQDDSESHLPGLRKLDDFDADPDPIMDEE